MYANAGTVCQPRFFTAHVDAVTASLAAREYVDAAFRRAR